MIELHNFKERPLKLFGRRLAILRMFLVLFVSIYIMAAIYHWGQQAQIVANESDLKKGQAYFTNEMAEMRREHAQIISVLRGSQNSHILSGLRNMKSPPPSVPPAQ